jgi:hypothetical protein
MRTYQDLSDDDIEQCISGKLLTVSQVRSILETPGIIINNVIDEELFSQHFNRIRDTLNQVSSTIDWPCGYFTANDLQDKLND